MRGFLKKKVANRAAVFEICEMKILAKTIFSALLAFACAAASGENKKFDEAVAGIAPEKFFGFDKFSFDFGGRKAIFVKPAAPRGDGAWVLRPAFFGAFPKADEALLKRGFFVAYCDVTHLYASPKAMKILDEFYKTAVEKFGMSKKLAVEGLSRGGACALNWANHDPSKFAAVYADAPVCDFRVWPTSPKLKADLLKEWGIKSMDEFRGNPLENFERLAKSGVPVLIVAGDSDKPVPYNLNGKLYAERFSKAGGDIKTIVKKGCGHHPHGLDDPAPIVEFIEKSFGAAK